MIIFVYTKCPSWCLGEPHEPLSAVIIVIVWTKTGCESLSFDSSRSVECKCWSSLCSLTLRFVEWAVAKTYLQSVLIDFSFNISFATLLPRYARVWKALSRALAARLFLPKIVSFASFDKQKSAYSKNLCESFSLVVWALASYDRLGDWGIQTLFTCSTTLRDLFVHSVHQMCHKGTRKSRVPQADIQIICIGSQHIQALGYSK